MLNLYVKLAMLRSLATERLHRDETGATAVEYGIMVALIAVLIIAAVQAVGDQLVILFGEVVDALS